MLGVYSVYMIKAYQQLEAVDVKQGQQRKQAFSIHQEKYGGEAGIRTPGSFHYTRFPGEHHRPLGHLSASCKPYTNNAETVK